MTERSNAVEAPTIPGVVALVRVGSGGVGDLFRGRQMSTGKGVAVKVLPRPLDRRSRALFDRERARLGRLKQVPAILQIDIVDTLSDGRPYLISELCAESAAELLDRRGPLREQALCVLGYDLADALANAHQLDLIHGAVTLRNVLFRRSGQAALSDFGTALRQTYLGEPADGGAFSSPETLRDGTLSPAADLYGLGAVLYTLLTGHPPFENRIGEHPSERILRVISEPAPPVDAHLASPALGALLAELLETDPEDRPSDAGTVADRFAELANGTVPVPDEQPPAPAAPAAAAPEVPAEPHWTEPHWTEPHWTEPHWTEPQPEPEMQPPAPQLRGALWGQPAAVEPASGQSYDELSAWQQDSPAARTDQPGPYDYQADANGYQPAAYGYEPAAYGYDAEPQYAATDESQAIGSWQEPDVAAAWPEPDLEPEPQPQPEPSVQWPSWDDSPVASHAMSAAEPAGNVSQWAHGEIPERWAQATGKPKRGADSFRGGHHRLGEMEQAAEAKATTPTSANDTSSARWERSGAPSWGANDSRQPARHAASTVSGASPRSTSKTPAPLKTQAETSTDWSRLLDDVLCDVTPEEDREPVRETVPPPRLIAKPAEPIAAPKSRTTLHVAGAVIIGLLLLMIVATVSTNAGNKSNQASSSSAGAASKPRHELIRILSVKDNGTSVIVTFTGPPHLQYNLVMASPDGRQVNRVAQGRTVVLPVQSGTPYCFQLQATNGESTIRSAYKPLRGAVCQN